MSQQIAITGNTFPVKDALKALGAKWNSEEKAWMVSAAKAEAARKLVAGAPRESAGHTGKCSKCRGEVKAPYTICYQCKVKAEGRKCIACGQKEDTSTNSRGYRNGERFYGNECQSCYEERKMGY